VIHWSDGADEVLTAMVDAKLRKRRDGIRIIDEKGAAGHTQGKQGLDASPIFKILKNSRTVHGDMRSEQGAISEIEEDHFVSSGRRYSSSVTPLNILCIQPLNVGPCPSQPSPSD
jgi:hypothetical protein